MRRLSAIIISAILLITIGGCSDNAVNKITGSDYPVTVYGIEIAECPQKVISLSPAITDVIITLGSDAQLIGVSDNCDNKRDLKVYGSSVLPDVDKIVASDAEIVIADGSLSDEAKKQISDSGKQILITPSISKYEELEELYKSIASVFSGYSTGKNNAENTFGRIDKRVTSIKNKVEESTPVSAVILLSDGIAAPKGSLADQMLKFAGGKNIASDQYSINYAEIVKANPKHIFCPSDMVDSIISDKALAEVDAIKNGKITALSPLYFERYGENIALSLEIMASSLHPDLVKSPLR